VALTGELVTPGEEDTWAFEEDDDAEGADDGEGVAEAEAEAALVPGEVDVARDGEGADEELSCVGDGCEEEEGDGDDDDDEEDDTNDVPEDDDDDDDEE